MALPLLVPLCLFFSSSQQTSADVQVTVTEDSDAVLPCSLSTKENIETKLFDWKKGRQEVFFYNGGQYYGQGISGQDKQFEGRVSHFNEELKNGNASIKIRETKMADSGNYTCIFPLLQPRQTFTIELVVECILKDRTKEEPGAAPKPSVQALNKTSNDQAGLQCAVKGASPEATVEWRDSSGNILHAEEPQVTKNEDGSYDIILKVAVTKADTYTCVVTQDAIGHQISNDLHMHIHEKVKSIKDNTGWFAGPAIGAVGVMFIALVLTLSIPSLRNKVIDFLCRRRLPPQRQEVIQMDSVPEEPEQNPVDEYHDDPGSGYPGSRRDSGITQSSNGSMLN